MRPHAIGRFLGIGVRVAGRVAGQRIAANGNTAAEEATPQPAQEPTVQNSRAKGEVAGRTTRGVARGVGGFLRPFGHVGGTIWLQVTGVFFFLPVVGFSPILWRTHMSWLQGPDHKTFWVTAVVIAIFFYLSVTSFWRASRR